VIREFPDKNHISLLSDDCSTLSTNTSFNSSKEAYMKAIIGHQEQTIQYLVNKIKDSFDIFLKVIKHTFNNQYNFTTDLIILG